MQPAIGTGPQVIIHTYRFLTSRADHSSRSLGRKYTDKEYKSMMSVKHYQKGCKRRK